MAPKKKAPAAPPGPTPQEVEETYKQMDATLEAELALLAQQLLTLQSDARHNEGLVDRYTAAADANQIAISALEKEAAAELLHLARLGAAAGAQLKHHEDAVAAADGAVDGLYDAMGEMRRADAAIAEAEAAESVGNNRSSPQRLHHHRHEAADGSGAAVEAAVAEEDTIGVAKHQQTDEAALEPAFPPPLGTLVAAGADAQQHESTLMYTTEHQHNTNSLNTSEDEAAPSLLHTAASASALPLTDEGLADLFYARSRQLALLKERLAAMEAEEAAMAGMVALSSAAATATNNGNTTNTQQTSSAQSPTSFLLHGGGSAASPSSSYFATSRLLGPLREASSAMYGRGGADSSAAALNASSSARHLFLPRPDRRAAARGVNKSSAASATHQMGGGGGGSTALASAAADGFDDYGCSADEDGDGAGDADDASFSPFFGASAAHHRGGGDEEGLSSAAEGGGGGGYYYRGEPRPELARGGGKGGGGGGSNNNGTSTAAAAFMAAAIPYQLRKQRAFANYVHMQTNRGGAATVPLSVGASEDTVGESGTPPTSLPAAFPVVLFCAPSVAPFGAIAGLVDRQQQLAAMGGTPLMNASLGIPLMGTLTNTVGLTTPATTTEAANLAAKDKDSVDTSFPHSSRCSAAAPPFALDMSFSVLSSLLARHYGAAVHHTVVAPQSLFAARKALAEEEEEEDIATDASPAFVFPSPLIARSNRFVDGRATATVCPSAAPLSLLEGGAGGSGSGSVFSSFSSTGGGYTLAAGGAVVVGELLALRDAVAAFVEKAEAKRNAFGGAGGGSTANATPAIVVVLRGRVVPSSGSGYTGKKKANSGRGDVAKDEVEDDDDVFITFADIDDGPSAVPPLSAAAAMATAVGATATAAAGGSGEEERPVTVSVKSIIATVGTELAALLATSPAFATAASSPAFSLLPQIIVFIEANGSTAGAGIASLSHTEADVSNDGFVMAVGPTTATRFCYKRKAMGGGDSGSGGVCGVSASGSLVASALTTVLSTSSSSSGSSPALLLHSASSLADAVFDELQKQSPNRVVFPRRYCPPSWASFEVPSPLASTTASVALLTAPNPPLPADKANGSGLIAADGSAIVSFFVPKQAIDDRLMRATLADDGKVGKEEEVSEGVVKTPEEVAPAGAVASASEEAKRQEAIRDIAHAVLSRHLVPSSDPSSSSTPTFAVPIANDLLMLYRNLRHEHALHGAVGAMAAEVAGHLKAAAYDTIVVPNTANGTANTNAANANAPAVLSSPQKGSRLFPAAANADNTIAAAVVDTTSTCNGLNDTAVTLGDVSVVYAPHNPMSPFHSSAAARASPAASKFAATVRSRVNVSGVGTQQLYGSNNGDITASNTIGNSGAAFSSSSVAGRGGNSPTMRSPHTARRDPIFLLLTQRIPLSPAAEEGSSNVTEEPALRYAPMLRELQQELTYRRLEVGAASAAAGSPSSPPPSSPPASAANHSPVSTDNYKSVGRLPTSACYRVDIWGAAREEIITTVAGNKDSSAAAAVPHCLVSVVVALWPTDEDPLERWWLRARHEARQAADRKRWDARARNGPKGSYSVGGGAAHLSALDGSLHPHRSGLAAGAVHTHANASSTYSVGGGRSSGTAFSHEHKSQSLRATAVSVAEAATSMLTPPLAADSAAKKGGDQQGNGGEGNEGGLSVTDAVVEVCRQFFSRAGAFGNGGGGVSATADSPNPQEASTTGEAAEAEAENASAVGKEAEAIESTAAQQQQHQHQPNIKEEPAVRQPFVGQWELTPLVPIGAVVHLSDFAAGVRGLIAPINNGEAAAERKKEEGVVAPQYYCLAAAPLPAIGAGAPVRGRLCADAGRSSNEAAVLCAGDDISLHCLTNLTVQRRYGLAKEVGAVEDPSSSPSDSPPSSLSIALPSPAPSLLRPRGPLVALFVVNTGGAARGDASSSSSYAVLQQRLAFRLAISALVGGPDASLVLPAIGAMLSSGRDVLPLIVASAELSGDATDEGKEQQQKQPLPARRALAALAPPSVLDFLSSQQRATPYSCLVLFQSTNRSIGAATTTGSSTKAPVPAPSPWVIRGRLRVLASASGATAPAASPATASEDTARNKEGKKSKEKEKEDDASSRDEVVGPDGVLRRVSAEATDEKKSSEGSSSAGGAKRTDSSAPPSLATVADETSDGTQQKSPQQQQPSASRPLPPSALIVPASDIARGLAEYLSCGVLGMGTAQQREGRLGFGL